MKRAVKLTIAPLTVILLSAALYGWQSGTGARSANAAPESKPAPISCAAPGSFEATSAGAMSSAQADAILDELRQIRRLLEKQQTQLALSLKPATDARSVPVPVQMNVQADWRSIGPSDAPITVIEFTDYECPFCRQFHLGTFADLKKDYVDAGKVRWVSRDLPLDIHPHALKAAEAARCAGDQNKFWEMRDALLSADAPPDEKTISQTAESLSLNMETFLMCMDSHKFAAGIRKEAAEAAELQIRDTPTFVIAKSASHKLEGTRIVGTQSLATFEQTINALLKH